jgi:hypothetical protein
MKSTEMATPIDKFYIDTEIADNLRDVVPVVLEIFKAQDAFVRARADLLAAEKLQLKKTDKMKILEQRHEKARTDNFNILQRHIFGNYGKFDPFHGLDIRELDPVGLFSLADIRNALESAPEPPGAVTLAEKKRRITAAKKKIETAYSQFKEHSPNGGHIEKNGKITGDRRVDFVHHWIDVQRTLREKSDFRKFALHLADENTRWAYAELDMQKYIYKKGRLPFDPYQA